MTGQTEKVLRRVSTPCLDESQLRSEDFQEKGHLHLDAAKVVMKVLYMALVARPDVLWPVNCLAREVTRWSVACDK